MQNNAEASKIALLYAPEFHRSVRLLAKRYHHIKSDLQPLLDQLQQGQTPGDQVQQVAVEVFKVRLGNTDAGRGKSGGYRVIYYRASATQILLVTIYAKSDQGTISAPAIQQFINVYQSEQAQQSQKPRVEPDDTSLNEAAKEGEEQA